MGRCPVADSTLGRSVKRGIMKMSRASQYAKSVILAAIAAATAIGCAHAADVAPLTPVKAPPKPIPFFIVNDTSVSFTYFPSATDPGVAGGSNVVPGGISGERNALPRYQGSIDHFDVWEYGTNFIHAEMNQYGPQDPNDGIVGSDGTREFWASATSTLGFNELGHTKLFSTLLTKDVSLMINGVAGVQNNFLSEETTQFAPGLQFDLNLPGTVSIGVAGYKEFSHNSFLACGNTSPFPGVGVSTPCLNGGADNGDRDFLWTWKIFTTVNEPLTFLPAASSFPLTLQNLLNVTGPKGTGITHEEMLALPPSFGSEAYTVADAETKVEVFEQVKLVLDTSQALWGKPGIWDTFIGYRYWYNKFGTDHNAYVFSVVAPGTSVESTFLTGMTYHFK
jgi:hypothetical protein